MALLIFYAQVIRGDRLHRLDAFYLHHFKGVTHVKTGTSTEGITTEWT